MRWCWCWWWTACARGEGRHTLTITLVGLQGSNAYKSFARIGNMSARHLKRLQEQQRPAAGIIADGGSSSDEADGTDAEESPAAKAPFNPFDLLSDDDDSDEQVRWAQYGRCTCSAEMISQAR